MNQVISTVAANTQGIAVVTNLFMIAVLVPMFLGLSGVVYKSFTTQS